MFSYKAKITSLIKRQLPELNEDLIRNSIETPPRPEMGDYAFPCFKLARILRKAPNQIASDLANQLITDKYFNNIMAEGPYVNFFINSERLATEVLKSVYQEKHDFAKHKSTNKTIVIDYSSPNIAKPFHVGHLRSTIIGQSLFNIFNHLGYSCIGINHLGDWGTQFGKQILAYKLWGNDEIIKQDPINEFVKLYVRFHNEADERPELVDEARVWFKKLEDGDPESLKIFRWISNTSLQEFNKLYERLNVKFDYNTGESFYLDKVPAVVEELRAKNLLVESDGALVVELGEEMPPCLITKTDGTTIYTSRDIAAAFYRKKTFNFDKAIYVTDYSQNLHFKQWRKVIELMGYGWVNDIEHVPFGRVRLTEGKMSTRKGNVILLEDVISEAIEKTNSIIAERNPNLPDKDTVAEQVALGAIIFNDLYNNRINDIVFDWDHILNFEGETGPYLQYTYARSCRVLEKASQPISDDVNFSLLKEIEAVKLIKSLYDFPSAIEHAATECEPSNLGRHLMQIARNYNRFYHHHQIICNDSETQKARLLLCYATNTVLKIGLDLLNMPAPKQM